MKGHLKWCNWHWVIEDLPNDIMIGHLSPLNIIKLIIRFARLIFLTSYSYITPVFMTNIYLSVNSFIIGSTFNITIQIYIKNGDSSKLLSPSVLMDYIIDSVINSPDIMKSYWLTIWFTLLIYRFLILKHKIKRQTQPRGDCAGFKI